MVEHLPQDVAEEDDLPKQVAGLRVAIESLIDSMEQINRRSTFDRWVIFGLGVVLVAVAAMGGYGFWYIHHTESEEREELLDEQARIENTFRNGCENANNLQQDWREEQVSFMQYLGERNNIPQAEIDLIITERLAEFNRINPPRNCEAEAEARAVARNE